MNIRNSPVGLKPIAFEYLYEGLVLAEDIYSHDARVLLLSKGNTLTGNTLRQLKDFNGCNRNVLVLDKTYRALIEHGLSSANALDQQYLEERVGYSALGEKAGRMLEEIQDAGRVSAESAGSIAGDLMEKLRSVDSQLIFQCINSPNPIDEYLRRHSVNVALINGFMGRWLKLPDADVTQLVLAGLVHDVGKLRIPPEILNAPRKLTVIEFEAMKMHPVFSYELLGADGLFGEQVRQTALHHHERMNGSGYPDGLTADEIPFYAKITAVSDIYDAMASQRAYREAENPFSIIARLANQQFSELDIQLVRLFTEHMPAELVDKPVLLSDGSIGVIRFIVPNDLEHPLVDIGGEVKQTDEELYCLRMVL